MSAIDWKNWLTQWSGELIVRLDHDAIDVEEFPHVAPLAEGGITPDHIAAPWFGYPGASEAQLVQLEARLNARLPLSYRAFLQISNGWRQPGHVIPKLWSTTEIDWFAARNQATIDAWNMPTTTDSRSNVIPISPVPDEDYFVYGDQQYEYNLRVEYMQTALEISAIEYGGTAVYLLNPQIVTPEGEWEAWFFAHWLPGAQRYRSFWELMQAQREAFLAQE